jgi:tRNA (guanine37-N1)-methyltransferase
MVMRADVLDAALTAKAIPGAPTICFTPRGKPLAQARVRALAALPAVVMICGRFEGIDQRLIEERGIEEVSLGDFVLSGGEPAAIALTDACVRLLPGVVGDEVSLAEESFESGLLEYPHYTRPQSWLGREVPAVLLSGHHEKIRAWRREAAERITRERRPDLWARYVEEHRMSKD